MDLNQRIAQFETMVRPGADPDNDMAWFSLAGAYAQAGRHADAAAAYQRCIELNGAMSKAYQLGGKALIDAGNLEAAKGLLRTGYIEAARRGDRLPQRAMGELLLSLGVALPEVKPESTRDPESSAPGGFVCRRSGRPGTKMARPPFRGPVGAWIAAHISEETFKAWIAQGTKVINELRLDLSREDHSETYDQHMREFLGIDEELLREIQQARTPSE